MRPHNFSWDFLNDFYSENIGLILTEIVSKSELIGCKLKESFAQPNLRSGLIGGNLSDVIGTQFYGLIMGPL